MSRRARTAALIAATFLAWAWPVAAQDAATAVCGVPLTNPDGLGWQHYLELADAPLRAIDYDALAEMTKERAVGWPADIRNTMLAALKDFETGELRGVSITKIGSLETLRQVGFAQSPREIELPLDPQAATCRDPVEATARVDAAYVILLMEKARVTVLQPGMAASAEQIGMLEREYDRYLFEGFPMFPWEAWVNSHFLAKDTIAGGPPRNAIVFLHPAAGMVGSIESGAQSDIGGVLSIEPLGWIRYSGDYDEWYGVSLLAVFPTDRNAGYGVAFNYKNYKLGVTWHDDEDTNHDGAAIFLGMDLLQFLDSRFREYKSYREKVDETLASIGPER